MFFAGRAIARPSFFFLERQVQGHLDLTRAAYGFVDYAQAGGRVVEGLTYYWKVVVELVLGNVVDGDVEAGGIGYVENIEGIFQRVALGKRSQFGERNVGAALP